MFRPSVSSCKSCTTSTSKHSNQVEGEGEDERTEPDQSASAVATAESRSVASDVECGGRFLTASGVRRDLLEEDGGVVEGGFGSVEFHSSKSQPKERFALKKAKDTPAGRRQMLREIAFFHHVRNLVPPLPNVVRVAEAVERPTPMLLMYREEATLTDMLEDGEATDIAGVVRVLNGVLCGIEGLHDLGFFHRDIKPDNILVGEHGTGILVDFGLCMSTKKARDGQGIGDGTPEYAAPETAMRGWSLAAEIYSVFVCLTEAVVGRCPFGGQELFLMKEERVADVMAQHEELEDDVGYYRDGVAQSCGEDLHELRQQLEMVSGKLQTIRAKMLRLQLDIGSWVPDKATPGPSWRPWRLPCPFFSVDGKADDRLPRGEEPAAQALRGRLGRLAAQLVQMRPEGGGRQGHGLCPRSGLKAAVRRGSGGRDDHRRLDLQGGRGVILGVRLTQGPVNHSFQETNAAEACSSMGGVTTHMYI